MKGCALGPDPVLSSLVTFMKEGDCLGLGRGKPLLNFPVQLLVIQRRVANINYFATYAICSLV